MRTHLATAVAAALAVLTGAYPGMAAAHHSFAMYDQEHPVELVGTVIEFRYANPHTLIVLEVRDQDGNVETWNLEGGSTSQIAHAGWTATSIKPGDVVRAIIEPLRTGAPGGAWSANRVWFLDGQPVVLKVE